MKKQIAKTQSKPLIKTRQATKHHLTKLLVPHRSNQYRPHLIRPFGLMAIIIVALGIPAMTNQLSTGSVLGTEASVTPAALYTETNTVRHDHGLGDLQANAKLSQAAADKAHDMLTYDYWAHDSPSGVTPWHWFDVVGYNYSAAGENLAKNFSSSSGVMSAWMASPEHRANLLDNRYTDVGIAVVHGTMDGQPIELVVAEYGQPAPPTATLASSASVLAANDAPLSSWQHFQIALNSLTPVAVASIVILLVAAAVALFAHAYRGKMPKTRRIIWYRHPALYKTLGLASLVVIVISLYGGGQI